MADILRYLVNWRFCLLYSSAVMFSFFCLVNSSILYPSTHWAAVKTTNSPVQALINEPPHDRELVLNLSTTCNNEWTIFISKSKHSENFVLYMNKTTFVRINEICQKTKGLTTRYLLETGSGLMCSGRVNSFCFHYWHSSCYYCYKSG